jgi:hypothetical protein
MDRAHVHRLTPDRALHTVDEAVRFIREVGVALWSPDPYLPSLFGAAQGRPYKPGVGGFGNWPAHAWWWDRKIAEFPDIMTFKLVQGRTTFAAKATWPAIDAAVRGRPPEIFDAFTRDLIAELRRRGATPGRELQILQRPGRANAKLLRKARNVLERRGLLIAKPIVHGDHHHDILLELWETRFLRPLTKVRGIEPLLLACLSASAGPVPMSRAFSWLTWPRDNLKIAIATLAQKNLIRETPNGQIERLQSSKGTLRSAARKKRS